MTMTSAMMALVSMVTFLGVCVVPLTSQKSSSSSSTSGGSGGKIKDAAFLRELLKILRIEKVPEKTERPLQELPEYMKKLYELVAYEDGISKQPHPYNADIVRAILNEASGQQNYYFFNVSNGFNISRDILLEAEFHLFKLSPSSSTSSPPSALPGNDRPRHRTTRDVNVIDLLLYEVLRPTARDDVINDVIGDDSLRLLHRRQIGDLQSSGWEVFNVSATVRRWMENPVNNNGFLVRILSPEGQRVNGTHLRFAQRMEHHDSKQPVLIVFTDDKTRHVTTSNDFTEREAYNPPTSDSDLSKMQQTYTRYLKGANGAQHGTHKRPITYMSPAAHDRLVKGSPDSHGSGGRGAASTCERQNLTIRFSDVGWDSWILEPGSYSAYQCKGVCGLPLAPLSLPITTHANLQLTMHEAGVGEGIDAPCCVPHELIAMSILYLTTENELHLKNLPDMVAVSCGCH